MFAILTMLTAVGQLNPGQLATYMAPARYPATSVIEDPEAPGGHGVAEGFPPAPLTQRLEGGLRLVIEPSENQLHLRIQNGGQPVWLDATDGNLSAWMELRDGDAWKPAEYHMWAWCGNSHHRVVLPSQHEFTYLRVLPSGRWSTQVRFGVKVGEEVVYSNPVALRTMRNRLLLNPDLARENEVHTEWTVPTLVPRRN